MKVGVFKKPTDATATELADLVEQLADSVWLRKEDIDRRIRNIRGELAEGERGLAGRRRRKGRRPSSSGPMSLPRRATLPHRQKWMRDTVSYVGRRGYEVVSQRERQLPVTEAYDRVIGGRLPVSILVDMFVDAVGDRAYLTGVELQEAKARLVETFTKEGRRCFDPDGTEQHRRRFFQKLIAIGERELGVNWAARRAAARRRRTPAPLARVRQRQREALAAWAHANVVKDAGSVLAKSELTGRLVPWWRENCGDIPEPSPKMLAAVFGKPVPTGKHHRPLYVGLKLRT